MSCRPRHSRERGAAVFIVVMMVTLLTAIGLFSIRAASLTDAATGNLRQQAQTVELAEYATRLNVITKLSNPDLVPYTLTRVDRSTQVDENGDQIGGDFCFVNRNVDLTGTKSTGCCVYENDDFADDITTVDANMTLLAPQTATSEGSFGPPLTAAGDLTSALEGMIRVEMHDAFDEQDYPGMGANSTMKARSLATTTFAQIRMTGASTAGWCPNSVAAPSTSMLVMRARVIVPVAAN